MVTTGLEVELILNYDCPNCGLLGYKRRVTVDKDEKNIIQCEKCSERIIDIDFSHVTIFKKEE